MAKIALIFFLFALFAVCMCGRVPREEPANAFEAQVAELLEKAKTLFSDENLKEIQAKATAAAGDGLAAFQKFSNTLNEQIQKTSKP